MSAQPIEIRMAHLEGAYEQISERLTSIDHRIGGQEQRMEQRFTGLEKNIGKTFFWVLGLILVSIILPVAQRLVLH